MEVEKQTYQDGPEEREGLLWNDRAMTAKMRLGERVRRGFLPMRRVQLPIFPYSISHQAAIDFAVEFWPKKFRCLKDKSRTVPFRPPGVL